MQREQQLECDLLVVGGGINGVGIARDAAGRGLKVVLAEKDDLGAHTSSSSTKLVHGGLRYLEHYEFGLVRKSLAEREVLLRNAPHIIWPLRFLIPHDPSMRPVWMIRIGLFLYDHLARREILPGSETVDLRRHEAGTPLKSTGAPGSCTPTAGSTMRGWWCSTRSMPTRGARRCWCAPAASIRRGGGLWRAELQADDGQRLSVQSRALVNAAGPWAASFLRERPMAAGAAVAAGQGQPHRRAQALRPRHAYIFQNPDKRIIFAIPFERDFTLIGTTDVEIGGDHGRGARRCCRDRLPVRRWSTATSAGRSSRPMSSGPTRACVRCSTTAAIRRR